MELGKIPPEILEEIILNPINNSVHKRDDIVLRPKTGEDCSVVDLKNQLLVVSTDPITGSTKNAGYLAVHINCNDIAASGGEPIGILLTILLPKDSSQLVLEEIMNGAYKAANELKIEILGGHTEVTDAVNKPIVSGAVIGKTINKKFTSTSGATSGQDVIMTKWAALEGTSIIAHDYEDKLAAKIDATTLSQAKSFIDLISVVPEGIICANSGATSMHDITEGGVLGAAWEIAHVSNLGIDLYLDKVPLKEETKTICHIANVDPYKLISSGSMIVTANNGTEIVEKLNQAGIFSAIIGKITNGKKQIINSDGSISPLLPPTKDEIYNINF